MLKIGEGGEKKCCTSCPVLTPGRYVSAAEVEDDAEPFAEKMKRLTANLKKQMEEGE